MSAPHRVTVIGSGLIGASAALALRREGVEVRLTDRDPARLAEAVERGAGIRLAPLLPPADVVLLAVPPAVVAPALADAQRRGLGHVYSDVAGVKTEIIAEADGLGCDLSAFVPGHPFGGGETSGPARARADLFENRIWALCPSAGTRPEAVGAVRRTAELTGAIPYVLGAEAHDRAAALVSHVPHLVSSALAALLTEADPVALRLAGRGLRDVTRIAAGDPDLWAQIVVRNARPTADLLDDLAAEFRRTADDLRGGRSATNITALLARGRQGTARLSDV
jgi:prephenate dehydrogenase